MRTRAALAAVLVLAGLALAAGARAQDPAAPAATGAATAADDAAPASPVTLAGRVEPDTVTIGSRFRYALEVAAPAGTEVVLAQPTERIGEFDIVDFGEMPPVERDGRRVLARWYTLVGWETGYKLIESPPVFHRDPGGERAPVPAIETVVTVESLLAQEPEAADLRPIKGPIAVPVDWRPYWIAAGILALAVALAFALARLLGRGRRPAPAPPPRPAHEIAYERLARLRRQGLIERGAFKEYYSGLSDIVRAYVEQRFGLRAPEMTTEEFLLTSARDGALQGTHRTVLGGFLRESDLVKFARHLPTIDDSERAYQAARRFVDETAPAAPEDARAAR